MSDYTRVDHRAVHPLGVLENALADSLSIYKAWNVWYLHSQVARLLSVLGSSFVDLFVTSATARSLLCAPYARSRSDLLWTLFLTLEEFYFGLRLSSDTAAGELLVGLVR